MHPQKDEHASGALRRTFTDSARAGPHKKHTLASAPQGGGKNKTPSAPQGDKTYPPAPPAGAQKIHQRCRGLQNRNKPSGTQGVNTETSISAGEPTAPVLHHRCFIHCIVDTIARAAEAGLAIRGRAAPWQRMADCRRSGGIVRTSLPKCDGCRNDSAAVMHARPACGPRRAESCGCQKVARRQRRSSCCGLCPEIACTGTSWPRNSMKPPTAHRRRSACDWRRRLRHRANSGACSGPEAGCRTHGCTLGSTA